MFQVFVTHPYFTFRATPEFKTDCLEEAIDRALQRINRIKPICSVWIETDKGEKLALMN